MKKSFLLKILNFWPPFLGAGIRVKKIATDYSSIDVQMKLHFWNKNYVGIHYGGSIYSMTDPFYMLMLIEILGKDYSVLDKAASIRFLRPGRGSLYAKFVLSPETIENIELRLQDEDKIEAHFKTEITDESDAIIAVVEKIISIKRK